MNTQKKAKKKNFEQNVTDEPSFIQDLSPKERAAFKEILEAASQLDCGPAEEILALAREQFISIRHENERRLVDLITSIN